MSPDEYELMLYKEAIEGMNERARYQLANYLAHDCKLVGTKTFTILEQGNRYLLIDKDGVISVAYKGIG